MNTRCSQASIDQPDARHQEGKNTDAQENYRKERVQGGGQRTSSRDKICWMGGPHYLSDSEERYTGKGEGKLKTTKSRAKGKAGYRVGDQLRKEDGGIVPPYTHAGLDTASCSPLKDEKRGETRPLKSFLPRISV